MQTSTSTALLCTPRVAHNYLGSSSQKPSSTVQPDFETMPVLRKHPAGHTSGAFNEGYHFHPSRSNKKIIKITARVPTNETLSNPRYIAVEEKFTRTRTSLAIHDCRVVFGKDMYLVTAYWDQKAVANRSVFTTTGEVWRGEIVVTCPGRYIPYNKRVKNGPAVNTAVKVFVKDFKAHRANGTRIPTSILGKALPN
ncbi:hypothetical protein BJ322DRAFT_1111515 [Thelephora terrestris]|uniref:Uncharacterized protein n=1 Tax=Thelephora terrestris TaxID=56493 RepID=A0A9P6L3V5_9AGAM|nr:hypothetical protein BJ322DRAFT_1111515 [Thelephora terrestris]